MKKLLFDLGTICMGIGLVVLLTGSDARTSACLLAVACISLLMERGMISLDEKRRGF